MKARTRRADVPEKASALRRIPTGNFSGGISRPGAQIEWAFNPRNAYHQATIFGGIVHHDTNPRFDCVSVKLKQGKAEE